MSKKQFKINVEQKKETVSSLGLEEFLARPSKSIIGSSADGRKPGGPDKLLNYMIKQEAIK